MFDWRFEGEREEGKEGTKKDKERGRRTYLTL